MTVASRAPGTLAGLRPTKLYDTYARLSFAAKRAASACRASVLLSASCTRSGPALVRGTPHRAWVALTRVPAFGCRSEKRQKVPSAYRERVGQDVQRVGAVARPARAAGLSTGGA